MSRCHREKSECYLNSSRYTPSASSNSEPGLGMAAFYPLTAGNTSQLSVDSTWHSRRRGSSRSNPRPLPRWGPSKRERNRNQ